MPALRQVTRCPECGGEPIEITSNGDGEQVFLCHGRSDDEGFQIEPGCGAKWTDPFPEPDEQPGENL